MIKSVVKNIIRPIVKSSIKSEGISGSTYWSSLISATVENAAPTHVVLTFPAARTSLLATDITCTVNGVARVVISASWAGNVWTVVLASAVVYGDVVVMTFVKTGGTTNVTNNVVIDADLNTYITGLSTSLSSKQLSRLGRFIYTIKQGFGITSLSEQFDYMRIYMGQTSESSLKNIIGNAYHATLVNAVPFQAFAGFSGNGTSSYLRSNYVPSTNAVRLAQNDASFGVYINTSALTASCQFGTADVITGDDTYINILARFTGDISYMRLNHFPGSGDLTKATTDGSGMFIAIRNGANLTDLKAYHNKVAFDSYTGTALSRALSAHEIYELAQNDNGTATLFSTSQISFSFIGKYMTEANVIMLTDAFNGYKNSLDDDLNDPVANGDALSIDNINARAMTLVGNTYHFFEETQHATTPIWTIEKRTSADGLTFSVKSSPLLAVGGVGSFDEKGQADPSVIYDGVSDWKMWFDAINGSDVWDKIGYATSTDGNTWTKVGSVLERGASGAWDDNFVHHPCVIKNGSTYYMFYAGAKATSPNTYKIGLATSPDGINWTKHANNPLISVGLSGEFDDYYIRPSIPVLINGLWYMWYWAYDGANNSIGLAYSEDLITWYKLGKVLGDSAGDDSIDQPQSISPIVLGNIVKMWYSCYRGVVGGVTVGELFYAEVTL